MKNSNSENQALISRLKIARAKYRIQHKYGLSEDEVINKGSYTLEERNDIDMYLNEYVPLERRTREAAR